MKPYWDNEDIIKRLENKTKGSARTMRLARWLVLRFCRGLKNERRLVKMGLIREAQAIEIMIRYSNKVRELEYWIDFSRILFLCFSPSFLLMILAALISLK